MLLAAALMLDHVELPELASRLRGAVLETLQDDVRTRDLGGTASTEEFASAIVARLGSPDTLSRPPDARAPTSVVFDRSTNESSQS
jgi:hypothetical protein